MKKIQIMSRRHQINLESFKEIFKIKSKQMKWEHVARAVIIQTN